MKASIVVITYNEEKNIRKCLDSLVKQDYPDYEILVIDVSEDKTAEIAKQYEKVKVIKSKHKGFGVQRNIGIKLSQGAYIAFTDADCIAPSSWLKEGIAFLEKENITGVGGNAYPPQDSPRTGKCISCLGFPAGGAIGLDPGKDPISTCNAIFKKDALKEVGGFNAALKYGGEDTDLSKRLQEKGHTIKINPNSYIKHTTREFKDFLQWNIRRGKAKYHLNKSKKQLLMPLSVVAYPFTSKYKKVLKKRKELGLGWGDVLFKVPGLFFLRQVYMSKGWIMEAKHQSQSKSSQTQDEQKSHNASE